MDKIDYRNGFKRILAIVLALWFAGCWGMALLMAVKASQMIGNSSSYVVADGHVLRNKAGLLFANSFILPALLAIGIWCVVWVVKWVYRGFKPEAAPDAHRGNDG